MSRLLSITAAIIISLSASLVGQVAMAAQNTQVKSVQTPSKTSTQKNLLKKTSKKVSKVAKKVSKK